MCRVVSPKQGGLDLGSLSFREKLYDLVYYMLKASIAQRGLAEFRLTYLSAPVVEVNDLSLVPPANADVRCYDLALRIQRKPFSLGVDDVSPFFAAERKLRHRCFQLRLRLCRNELLACVEQDGKLGHPEEVVHAWVRRLTFDMRGD